MSIKRFALTMIGLAAFAAASLTSFAAPASAAPGVVYVSSHTDVSHALAADLAAVLIVADMRAEPNAVRRAEKPQPIQSARPSAGMKPHAFAAIWHRADEGRPDGRRTFPQT